jgi:hypothetical protein
MNTFLRGLILSVVAAVSITVLSGATITFSTPAGSTVGDGAVSAQAIFDFSDGSVTITLSDLLANPTSAGQLVSDLEFVLNGVTTDATLESSSAQQVTVDQNGIPTFGSKGLTGWALGTFGNGLILCVICPNGVTASATPSQEIIGAPDAGGNYSNANGSIAGNQPHNPFLSEAATFTITNSAITPNTTVSDVVFSFGTNFGGENTTVGGGTGQGGEVPEPATFGLLTAGLLGFGLLRRRSA